MYGLVREEYSFGSNPGTKDLARHMFTRMYCGKIVIVSDRPQATNAALRKQWLKLMRKVSKERSSTLNAARMLCLSDMIAKMASIKFTTVWPDDWEADVFIVDVERLLRWAPECRTIYITCDMPREQLHIITALMRKGSLVVECKLTIQ